MTKLGPEARAVVTAAREHEAPSAADRARVRGKLFSALGVTGASVGIAAAKAAEAKAAAGTAGALAPLSLKLSVLAVVASTAVTLVVLRAPASDSAPPPTARSKPALASAITRRAPVIAQSSSAPRARTATTAPQAGVTLLAAQPRPTAQRIDHAVRATPKLKPAQAAAPQRAAQPPISTPVAAGVEPDRAATPVASAASALTTPASTPVSPARAEAVAPRPAATTSPGPAPIRTTVAPPSFGGVPALRGGTTGGIAPALRGGTTSLNAELELLGPGQAALARGDFERALQLFEVHASRFPHGELQLERVAGQAIALCKLKRPAAARRALARLERLAPDSPLAQRIRAACN